MRADLTTAFRAKMGSPWRKPIQLLVFHFPISGDVYISDRDIVVGTQKYTRAVENWGELEDSVDAKEDTGETTQASLSILDIGVTRFSEYFEQDDPENVEVDYYQWFEGLEEIDLALIDTFSIQDPITSDEVSGLLKLDLVSVNLKYDGQVGVVLTEDDYKWALKSDLGKGIDLIVGSPGKIKTICSKRGAKTVLDGSIMSRSLHILVEDDIEELGFEPAGLLLIDDEVISYSGYMGKSFTVESVGGIIGRGQEGTTPTEHGHRTTVEQRILDHTYIVGQNVLSTINKVTLDKDYPADPEHYTVNPGAVPPTIVFDRKPRYTKLSDGVNNVDNIFDQVLPETAKGVYGPALAFDDEPNTSAIMREDIPGEDPADILALTRNVALDELGEIVSAHLEIEHWPSYFYESDYIEVSIDDISRKHILARPSNKDILDIIKSWNVSHGHDHKDGGDHGHGDITPEANSTVPAHDHTINGAKGTEAAGRHLTVPEGSTIGVGFWTSAGAFVPNFVARSLLWIIKEPPERGVFHHADITFKVLALDSALKFEIDGMTHDIMNLGGTLGDPSAPGYYEFTFHNVTAIKPVMITVSDYGQGMEGNNKFNITDMDIIGVYDVPTSIDLRNLSISTDVIPIPEVGSGGIFRSDDVLSADIPAIELDLSKENPGRSFIDKIDVTDLESVRPWAWFKDRKVTLRYVSKDIAEAPFIMITNVKWVIEYHADEVVYTTDVYCDPVAEASNRPDKVIQALLESTGFPEARMGNIVKNVPSWDDQEIWWYTLSWTDGGSVVDVIDTPFDLAAARYNALVYELNGVISATKTVRDAIKDICLQTRSRLIWTTGKARLTVREAINKWVKQKRITSDEIQLRSATAERQASSLLLNTLTINYDKDYSSNNEFRQNTKYALEKSVLAFKEKAEVWDFDLVSTIKMAEGLSRFYVDQRAFPSTFFTVSTYLPNFDIEKTDVLQIESKLQRLDLRKVIVRSVKRRFGSGKSKGINRIELLVESLNWKLHRYNFFDDIWPAEEMILKDTLFDDTKISDAISFDTENNFPEDVYPKDEFIQKWLYKDFHKEDVYSKDEFATELTIHIDDSVDTNDFDVVVYEARGFSLYPFALYGFGGVVPTPEIKADGVSASDKITITYI